MKQKETNSIRYSREIDEKMEKLAKGLGRSKKELFCQMVDYFYRSKKDPADPGDELLKKELSSGINRILSFIRQQEKDFLLPLFTDAGILKVASLEQNKVSDRIEKVTLSQNEHTELLIKRSEQIINGLKYMISKQKEKELLKEQFNQLLDYYVTQREDTGWTISGTKKEELIRHVKQSLKSL